MSKPGASAAEIFEGTGRQQPAGRDQQVAGRVQLKAGSGKPAAGRVQLILLIAATLSACDQRRSQPALFELLKPEATGVSFSNNLPEKPDFNILNYLYYYNGAG